VDPLAVSAYRAEQALEKEMERYRAGTGSVIMAGQVGSLVKVIQGGPN